MFAGDTTPRQYPSQESLSVPVKLDSGWGRTPSPKFSLTCVGNLCKRLTRVVDANTIIAVDRRGVGVHPNRPPGQMTPTRVLFCRGGFCLSQFSSQGFVLRKFTVTLVTAQDPRGFPLSWSSSHEPLRPLA